MMRILHQLADRFLAWYCNPEFLEEIQGDIQELHAQHQARGHRLRAELYYLWNVMRFCRLSNIRRTGYAPGIAGSLLTLNLKMAWRTSTRHKTIFAIKTLGLTLCLSFTLLLAAFIVSELTSDRFHKHHDRIYRVGLKANFKDHTTHFAVTPLPTGAALQENISGIERCFRFMHLDKPVFQIDGQFFNNRVALSADSNFLRVLSYTFVLGNESSLDGPNKMVLTERTAHQFFGSQNPIGQTVLIGKNQFAEVTGIIRDVPPNSHLQFDVLISWDTFDRNDDWGNINAYTYLLLRKGTPIDQVMKQVPAVFKTFNDLIVREYQATAEFYFDKITDIHLLGYLEEDVAAKSNPVNILILLAVATLFLIIGLINYLNLSLAELTANLKRVGIVKTLGGMVNSHRKIVLAESLLTLTVVLPATAFTTFLLLLISRQYAAFVIDSSIFGSFAFVSIAIILLAVILLSAPINSYVLSRTSQIAFLLKGRLSERQGTARARKYLVSVQLCFSTVMIGLMLVVADQFFFIQNHDKGFASANRLIVRLRSGPVSSIRGFEGLLSNLAGVESLSRSTYYPGEIETKNVFSIETETGMEERLVTMMCCSRNYLQSMGIHVEAGRHFADSASESDTYIVNAAAARAFGWKDPIGKKIRGPVSGENEAFQEGVVVGMTTDFHFNSLHNAVEPLIILADNEDWLGNYLYIKFTALHGSRLIDEIEDAYRSIWPDQVFKWEYLDQTYDHFYAKDRQMKSIFEFGLVISVIVCCLGIFSISALLLKLRTRESCIRKVVGANGRQLFALHTGAFLRLTVIAIVAAMPLIAYLADRWLSNFAYHVSLNRSHFVLPGLIAAGITLFASGYHGIRSGRVNLVQVLKEE